MLSNILNDLLLTKPPSSPSIWITCRLYVRKSGCNIFLQSECEDLVASIYNQLKQAQEGVFALEY